MIEITSIIKKGKGIKLNDTKADDPEDVWLFEITTVQLKVVELYISVEAQVLHSSPPFKRFVPLLQRMQTDVLHVIQLITLHE
jgi:hypothetical protein